MKCGESTNLLRVGRYRSRLSSSGGGLDVRRRHSTSVSVLAIRLRQLNRTVESDLTSGFLVNHKGRLGVGSGSRECKGRGCRSSHKGCHDWEKHSEGRGWEERLICC
jgi:hypothetical protein